MSRVLIEIPGKLEKGTQSAEKYSVAVLQSCSEANSRMVEKIF